MNSTTLVTMAESIDWLFVRLAGTYGAQWTRQWEGTPMSDVKTAWGYELSGYAGNPSAIRYALDSLPERCPNVIQFRNLCRAAPSKDAPRLEAPKASPEIVAIVLAGMAPAPARSDSKEWARRIVKRHDSGDRITPYSLRCARDALGLTVERESA
jgi:hypothetical protein